MRCLPYEDFAWNYLLGRPFPVLQEVELCCLRFCLLGPESGRHDPRGVSSGYLYCEQFVLQARRLLSGADYVCPKSSSGIPMP